MPSEEELGVIPACSASDWIHYPAQFSQSVKWSHFIASPFRPLRSVKNHFYFFESLEMHNVNFLM